jgi:hypothetical protein
MLEIGDIGRAATAIEGLFSGWWTASVLVIQARDLLGCAN